MKKRDQNSNGVVSVIPMRSDITAMTPMVTLKIVAGFLPGLLEVVKHLMMAKVRATQPTIR